MPAGRPSGTFNQPGHQAGGSRPGAGRKRLNIDRSSLTDDLEASGFIHPKKSGSARMSVLGSGDQSRLFSIFAKKSSTHISEPVETAKDLIPPVDDSVVSDTALNGLDYDSDSDSDFDPMEDPLDNASESTASDEKMTGVLAVYLASIK
ncbi:hypothetical protein H0H92_014825, partial [Tricholoma furcatifolium]